MTQKLAANERALVWADEPTNPQDALKGSWGVVVATHFDGHATIILAAPVSNKTVWDVDMRRLVRMPSDEELRAAWVLAKMEE